ncbi:hypothetical protein ACHAPT_008454 [Fusarium lateritium]
MASGTAAWVISQALLSWALWNSPMPVIAPDVIISDRQRGGLDADRYYVAGCGPSGSGKSSILNAPRGLLNRDRGAAETGTTETTLGKQEYEAAACFDRLSLVDFPGAGTQRVPSKEYFETNKLHCYDFILILCGERFGEIEIALVQACIVQGKRFAIVRSTSDQAIRQVEDDKGISLEEAKAFYIQTEVNAIAEELQRASLTKEIIQELLGTGTLDEVVGIE